MVAAQGNEANDLNHPLTDETSPDFPPGPPCQSRSLCFLAISR